MSQHCTWGPHGPMPCAAHAAGAQEAAAQAEEAYRETRSHLPAREVARQVGGVSTAPAKRGRPKGSTRDTIDRPLEMRVRFAVDERAEIDSAAELTGVGTAAWLRIVGLREARKLPRAEKRAQKDGST